VRISRSAWCCHRRQIVESNPASFEPGTDAPGKGSEMNGIGVHRIADAVTIPVDGKIVVCAPRQNMHMNVWHRLPGDFTVRLHQAQSARPQRLVHRASQLSHGCAHGSKTLRRHLEHGCKMGARITRQCPSLAGWMSMKARVVSSR